MWGCRNVGDREHAITIDPEIDATYAKHPENAKHAFRCRSHASDDPFGEMVTIRKAPEIVLDDRVVKIPLAKAPVAIERNGNRLERYRAGPQLDNGHLGFITRDKSLNDIGLPQPSDLLPEHRFVVLRKLADAICIEAN